MLQWFHSTPLSRRFVRMLRQAIATEDATRLATVTHHVPIEPPQGGLPTTYSIHLTPDKRGMFLVTCRELPSLALVAADEDEALAWAEQAIRDMLGSQRSSPDFPY